MADVVAAITGEGRGAPLTRVIYTESHDDVANDRVRLPEAIKPGDAGSWWSEKRATLGSALVLTSPGIPMLFQGQELLEDRWFDDTVALDWTKASSNEGILRLHHDLIALRRGGGGTTRGLRGEHIAILRADEKAKLLAFHRWHDGGPGDDVVVVANFADRVGRRPAPGVAGRGSLAGPPELGFARLRRRLRRPRGVRHRNGRRPQGRLRPERARLGRAVWGRRPVAGPLSGTRPPRDAEAPAPPMESAGAGIR